MIYLTAQLLHGQKNENDVSKHSRVVVVKTIDKGKIAESREA